MTDATLSEDQQEQKRAVLRLLPYGLHAVLARGTAGEINGFTANWVAQAAFEPPMVSVAVTTDSYTLQLIRQTRRYTLNPLPDGSVDLAKQLGKRHAKNPAKMAGISLLETASGTPALASAVGYVELELRGELDYAADHLLLVGEVVDAQLLHPGLDLQTMRAAGMKYSG
jgi:flavin reductase (DIM6/NTAB) family NADH-FMN oxidoreductase RutF